jgi:FkbH-like protein
MTLSRSIEIEAIARLLERHKPKLCKHFFEPLARFEKWEIDIQALGLDFVIQREFAPPADYLIQYLRNGDPAWQSLYLGHLLDQMRDPGKEAESSLELRRDVLDTLRLSLRDLLSTLTSDANVERFDEILKAMHQAVLHRAQSGQQIRMLLVGDCLLESLVAFMTIPLLEQGITLECSYATSRNPIDLRNSLRTLAKQPFDMVCYSPYSNVFNPVLYRTFSNPNPLQSVRTFVNLATEAHQLTLATLRILCERVDTTITVQNTANIQHENIGLIGGLYSLTKRTLSSRARSLAAAEVNRLLDDTLHEINQHQPRPLVKIDEVRLEREFGERALRKLFYDSPKYHPSVKAQKLSILYIELILAHQLLRPKKVLLTDLDDTLWKGTIGEGAIEHYRERQQILKDLRLKGVLLAVVSRNDPRNVHWTNGVLQSSDFVAEQINWDPKPTSIKRIAAELNLKLKDFVFIDDRADQLALVSSSIPEISVLDATDESSWRKLRWWAGLLPEQSETDRTQLYHERKQRESFLKTEVEEFDAKALFGALGLRLNVRLARPRELARAAELVNRTNQFNIGGTRTSLAQVTEWSKSPQHRILLVQAGDKFGDMGIVSVLLACLQTDSISVGAWVLSCRVFGYGIETVMLNSLRRLATRLQLATIEGRIVETSNNQPCRDVFSRNGFHERNGVWMSDAVAVTTDPEWLDVSVSEDLVGRSVADAAVA